MFWWNNLQNVNPANFSVYSANELVFWALVQNDTYLNMCFTLAYMYLVCFVLSMSYSEIIFIFCPFSYNCILSCYNRQSTSS